MELGYVQRVDEVRLTTRAKRRSQRIKVKTYRVAHLGIFLHDGLHSVQFTEYLDWLLVVNVVEWQASFGIRFVRDWCSLGGHPSDEFKIRRVDQLNVE